MESGLCQNGHHKEALFDSEKEAIMGEQQQRWWSDGYGVRPSSLTAMDVKRATTTARGGLRASLSRSGRRGGASVKRVSVQPNGGQGHRLPARELAVSRGLLFLIPFACHAQTSLHHTTARCKMDMSSVPCSSPPSLELPTLPRIGYLSVLYCNYEY